MTGVQTCALPISSEETIAAPKSTTPVVDPQEDDDADSDLPF